MGTKLAKNEIVQRIAENEALIALGAKQNFESILNISMGLKGMKDLGGEIGWKNIGYKDFEDYTITRWRLAHSQAAKYIKIAEKLPKTFFHSVEKSSKASLGRLLQLLPNDQSEFNLTPEEVEQLMLLPPDEFKNEMAKLTGYDRTRNGGRGPSDIERPKVSRDRYRDQRKKITRLEEKIDTLLDEKDELVGEIEQMEKQIEDLQKSSSPDREKDDLIQENKTLLLKVADLEKRVRIENQIKTVSRIGMKEVYMAIGECQIIFNRISDIELHSHQEWVEFRVLTDTIRELLDACEDHVGFVMAEKSLHPKEYEEWHDGSFKYHLDKATEDMKKEYIEKEQQRIDDIKRKTKEERKKRREGSAEDTTGDS